MEMDAYQQAAIRTLAGGENNGLAIMALGLAGESGEVADMIKKHLGHGHPLDKAKLAKELGDVQWYLAVLANLAGFKLSEIATMNVDKLKARYPDGFSTERSLNRVSE